MTNTMIWCSYLNFKCGVLLVTFLNSFQVITGVEWNSEYNGVYYKLVPVPNGVTIDEALVFAEGTSNALAVCSLFCWKESSVSLYYQENENTCYCNNALDTRQDVDTQTEYDSYNVMYGYISTSVQASSNSSDRRFDIQPYKENCFALYHHGFKTDATYSIKPIGEDNSQDTYCNMEQVLDVGADDCLQWLQYGYGENGIYKIRLSDGTSIDVWCDQQGGGWTVFQRRQDGSEDFYRNWTEYANGFGDVSAEHWLGLEAIHLLTTHASELRIDLETFGDVTKTEAYALYGEFSVHPATDKYKLSVGTYSGDCCDSLSYHNNRWFTTKDNDNDQSHTNCAIGSMGAWWYGACHNSNLNGKYHGINTNYYATGINWMCCWGHNYSLKSSSMKVRRSV